MSDLAIRADGVSKKYRIGGVRTAGYRTLRDTLAEGLQLPWRTLRSVARHAPRQPTSADTEFWALRDVGFEIYRGEVVGVVGRNGAGKSTLLKILSRITDPTTGEIDVFGHVGSLLEVGTGFHPELSGRENIMLNAAILGMTRAEVSRRFEAIVEFAEVARFIDTPVKHYSSGMYLRLAFAVAAHLESDILLVDEVLAVGDAAFQRKCLAKMDEAAHQGRTVLFVSHNLQAIAQLTRRVLVLQSGQVTYDGPTARGLAEYLAEGKGLDDQPGVYTARPDAQGAGREPAVYLKRAHVITSESGGEHAWGQPLICEFGLHIEQPVDTLSFSFQIVNEFQQPICHFWLLDTDASFRGRTGLFKLVCKIPKPRLYMGSYTLATYLAERRGNTVLESLSGICPFDVSMLGVHRPDYDWARGACAYIEDAEWSSFELEEPTTAVTNVVAARR